MAKAISVDERLSLMLRFFATGYSFSDLEADFKIRRTTICIYDCLKEEYPKIPQTKEDWKGIAEKTQERWQFPNCINHYNHSPH